MSAVTAIPQTEEYGQLLQRYRPAPIQTEAQYEEYLEAIEELMRLSNAGTMTPAQEAIYDLLTDIIGRYDELLMQESGGWPQLTPHELLAHLIEVNDLKQKDFIGILGSTSGAVSQIISGIRPIPIEGAKKLSKRFGLPLELFVGGC